MAGLASEVRVEEEAPTVRRISSAANTKTGVLGIFERGAIGEALGPFASLAELQKELGGYTANNLDTMADCQSYFDNGGTQLWAARVVHCTTPSDPTTKTSAAATLTLSTASVPASPASVTGSVSAPFDLEPEDTLVISLDGGSTSQTATFSATAASRTSAAEPYALSNGQTLLVSVNDGSTQTITFLTAEFADIGAASAAEVAAVINAKISGAKAVADTGAVALSTDQRGSGAALNVSGGTANTALQFTTGSVSGTGNVANIDAITSAEVKSIVEAAVSGIAVTSVSGKQKLATVATGEGTSLLVQSSSTAANKLGLDTANHTGGAAGALDTLKIDGKTDGSYANSIKAIVTAATSGNAAEFNLSFERNGVISERDRFRNVSMDPNSARYVVKVVNDPLNGSDLVTVTDLFAAVPSPNNKPAVGSFGPMSGGDDGLVDLDDNDYVGGASSNGDTGLRVFDGIDLDILIAPGQATPAVHNAMATYVEITRAGLTFTILDPPANYTAEQMDEYVRSTANLHQLTEYAAMYWPRILVANPNKTLYGSDAVVSIPPSGMLAGLYSRIDGSKIGGAFEHPAGTDPRYLPRNVLGLETKEVMKKHKRELIFPSLINPISKEDGTPIFVDGARTLRDTGNFPTIGQRRGVMFVEKKLIPGLAFMRHRNIREKLYQEAERTVTVFMNELTAADAFKSKDPAKAYFIDLGPALNPPSVQLARTVKIRIGMATSEPAEFIVLLIGPDTRALDEELAALAA